MSELEGLSPAERDALAKLKTFDMSPVYRVADELHKESDRAALVLGAAWLDDGLASLLRAALLPAGKKDDDELFSYGGPLGEFSARIKLCHHLGLLSDDVRKTIDIIRKIRNKYAHVVEPPDLTASPFRDWIRDLPVLIPSPTFWDAYQSKYYGAERGPRVTLLCTVSFACGLVAMSAASAKQLPAQPLLPTMLTVVRSSKR